MSVEAQPYTNSYNNSVGSAPMNYNFDQSFGHPGYANDAQY